MYRIRQRRNNCAAKAAGNSCLLFPDQSSAGPLSAGAPRTDVPDQQQNTEIVRPAQFQTPMRNCATKYTEKSSQQQRDRPHLELTVVIKRHQPPKTVKHTTSTCPKQDAVENLCALVD
ncbi:hypothetical protein CB1_001428059 [Camelus ferus]|nr:hypothetical protein CB1_001428059 [Camelus ferus]